MLPYTVDFGNSDFLKKSPLDLPSAWIFFLYLLLCMDFFSWHFPLHEFSFVPPPPHHFSNGPSPNYDITSWIQKHFRFLIFYRTSLGLIEYPLSLYPTSFRLIKHLFSCIWHLLERERRSREEPSPTFSRVPVARPLWRACSQVRLTCTKSTWGSIYAALQFLSRTAAGNRALYH